MARVVLAGSDGRTRSADLEWKKLDGKDGFAGAVRAQLLAFGLDESEITLKQTGATGGRLWAVYDCARGEVPAHAVFAYEAA